MGTPKIARIIGGAGTGKTTELLRLLELTLENGVRSPYDVGFVSFTRAARRTAADRAAQKFAVAAESLTTEGWFRTLHSVCFKALGCSKGEVLASDRTSRQWIAENVGDTTLVEETDQDLGAPLMEKPTEVDQAMHYWSLARNLLKPLKPIWQKIWDADRSSRHWTSTNADRVLPWETCRALIEIYERAKRLDHALDFTDLLAQVAGWSFHPNEAPERVEPEGEIPALPVWFFDEQQDTSPLLDAVCHRLIERTSWVYVCGDPFQAIYRFAGARPELFQAWPAEKQRILPKSYRCPAPILALGERILMRASDYWDRGIAPADHDGVVRLNAYRLGEHIKAINPLNRTLVLARTNHLAATLGKTLQGQGAPWRPLQKRGGWNAPAKMDAFDALYHIEKKQAFPTAEWRRVVEILPAAALQRGAKTRWKQQHQALLAGEPVIFLPENLILQEKWGCNEETLRYIYSGEWRRSSLEADVYWTAREAYGKWPVHAPNIRVGTIHAAKGEEADDVFYLTARPGRVVAGEKEDQESHNSERRVEYVAVTRARKNLFLLEDEKSPRSDVSRT